MKRSLHGIFLAVHSQHMESLGAVAGFINWGSHREIRDKGLRIGKVSDFLPPDLSITDACVHASKQFAAQRKVLPLIKDPHFQLQDQQIVFTPNGQQAVVFLLDRQD